MTFTKDFYIYFAFAYTIIDIIFLNLYNEIIILLEGHMTDNQNKNLEQKLEEVKEDKKACKVCCIKEHFNKDNGLTKSQLLTFHALITAVILVFTIVPIAIGPVTLAFLPLLAIIISTRFMGLKHGIISGGIFGLTSFILSLTIYSGTVMAVFQNPLVSILPRLLIAVSVYFVTLLINTKFKNSVAADTTGAIAGVLTNTIFVILMLVIFYFGKTIQGTVISGEFVLALVSINSLFEIVFCAVLAAPILRVLEKTIAKH